MDRAQLPLNALRAFEASARHLNFTRAALELCVSQGAVSQQVAALEARLGVALFRRLPRGLMLTDEGRALLPVMADALDRIGATLDRIEGGRPREALTLGVVGSFADGWLLDRLPDFERACPHVDLRILLNNNRVDLAGEGLDLAIPSRRTYMNETPTIRTCQAHGACSYPPGMWSDMPTVPTCAASEQRGSDSSSISLSFENQRHAGERGTLTLKCGGSDEAPSFVGSAARGSEMWRSAVKRRSASSTLSVTACFWPGALLHGKLVMPSRLKWYSKKSSSTREESSGRLRIAFAMGSSTGT